MGERVGVRGPLTSRWPQPRPTNSLPCAENAPIRHDWTRAEVRALFDLPFPELMFRAQSVHRAHFDPREVQVSTLLSIKTGGCPEDCAYCPQSASYETGVRAEKLMSLDTVLAEARAARDGGASRFCMGAAWRSPKDRDLDQVCAMVEGVKALGLETCATLGMLTAPQARGSRPPVSITTTTTSTLRLNITAPSSPRGPTRTASTRSRMCARPASTSAAAASSAWARARTTASA